jgi:hypothetical protein
MNELLEELKVYQQEMIDELNESSDDPEQDPDCDFSLGYIAGMGMVLSRMEEVINA